MKKPVSMFIFCIAFAAAFAQQEMPRSERPGTFTILNRNNYTDYKCGFTKSELAANLLQIADVVSIVRKNPVLSDIKGFEGRARIYNVDCTDEGNFGIPSRISFEFCSWYFNKRTGKEELGTIEPPEWTLVVNKLKPNTNRWDFTGDTYFADKRFFSVPFSKKTIEKGIDVYDNECYIIYNPDRPPYWLPVTVNEAFKTVREFYKNYDDKVVAAEMLKWIDKEYDAIPENERDSPAHGGGMISGVSIDKSYPVLVKINPDYWDKALPRSAVQFIYFRAVPDYYRKLRVERKERDGTYFQYYFGEMLDLEIIRGLVPLIGKV